MPAGEKAENDFQAVQDQQSCEEDDFDQQHVVLEKDVVDAEGQAYHCQH